MIVVADTSPLNYLLRLQHIELLPLLYGRVIVPDAVITELRHPKAPTAVRTFAATPPAWLEVRAVSNLDKTLGPGLGPGEREAISLALELRAGLLLIDELDGRQQALARKLTVAGTLAVLVQFALLGHLDLPDELQQLRRLGFRMSVAMESDTLALHHRLRTQPSF